MKKIFALFIFLFGYIGLFSQKITPFVIASGGHHYKGAQYNVSWTVGEIFTPTIHNDQNYITQGFQQPTGNAYISVPEVFEKLNNFSFYPNPFSDHLNVRVNNAEPHNYEVYVFNISGQLVEKPLVINSFSDSQVYSFKTTSLKTGVYLIKIIEIGTNNTADFKLTKI